MKNEQRAQFIVIPLLGACCLLLAVGVVQLNSLEGKLITQSQQLRALGEATEKVSGELKRRGPGTQSVGMAQGAADEDLYAGVTLLHPETKNFLGPKTKRWPPEGAPMDGVLRRDWYTGDPKGLNGMLEGSADVSEKLESYVVSSLANRNSWDDPDTWYGDLAFHLEITDDFKEYTFYLRKGINWQPVSGVDLKSPKYSWLDKTHPLTANDFVFYLDTLLNPQVESGALKNYYEDVESYKAVDEHTLVVRWKKKTFQSLSFTLGLSPLPQFLYRYAEDGTEYPKETFGLRFNQHWYNNKGMIGHGPYRLIKYEPGVKLELVRNEEYHGDKPAIQRIVYPIYTDSKQTILKLKSGELNFGELTPSQYREEVLAWQGKPENERPKNNPFVNGQLTCKVTDYPAYSYIGWNGDKPLFADAEVRTAMTLALDRKRLLQTAFAGLGTVANGPFLPATGLLSPDVPPLDFDLDKARALLAEAGWRDSDGDGLLDKVLKGQRTRFEFTLLIRSGSDAYTTLANTFKEDLLKIGVRMKVESAEWSLFLKRLDEKKFDAVALAWVMGWENDPYQLWHSSQADLPKGSNRVGFRNAEADKLIETLRVTFDHESRAKMFRRLHEIIYASQAYTFLRVYEMPYCWANEVRGVAFPKTRPIIASNPWWIAPTR